MYCSQLEAWKPSQASPLPTGLPPQPTADAWSQKASFPPHWGLLSNWIKGGKEAHCHLTTAKHALALIAWVENDHHNASPLDTMGSTLEILPKRRNQLWSLDRSREREVMWGGNRGPRHWGRWHIHNLQKSLMEFLFWAFAYILSQLESFICLSKSYLLW